MIFSHPRELALRLGPTPREFLLSSVVMEPDHGCSRTPIPLKYFLCPRFCFIFLVRKRAKQQQQQQHHQKQKQNKISQKINNSILIRLKTYKIKENEFLQFPAVSLLAMFCTVKHLVITDSFFAPAVSVLTGFVCNYFLPAKELGCTECMNPKDYDKPIQQVCFNLVSTYIVL